MTVPRLAMRGVAKRFGATAALRGVDLALAPGEIHALVGENGAGKSTLMKALSGAIRPDAGEMELDGKPFRPSTPHEARQAGVAMIYQELTLAPHLSVAENILLGTEPSRGGILNRRAMRRTARAALTRLGHGDLPLDAPAGQFTVAVRQIIEIARGLARGCRVLVLDEPTSSLARADAERLFDVVRGLAAEGPSVLYISHFLDEVQALARRFTVLRDGRAVGTGDVATTPPAAMVRMMVGRDLAEQFPRSARQAGEVLLEIRNLAGRRLPREATLTVRRGEVVGLAGLVGSGRTELLRSVFGLDPVVRGDLVVAGRPGPARPVRRIRQGVGLLSEDRKAEGLALNLSVETNLTLSRLPAVFGVGRMEEVARPWIRDLSIRCQHPGQAVTHLSGGNQQKAALARLLYQEADLVLLDEPTRGVDVGSKVQIYEAIDRIVTRPRPGAVLLAGSYFPELLGICDRIAVMRRGVLGPARPAAEWTTASLLEAATGAAA